MLSLYRSSRGSSNSSDEEVVIPAGTPYLTKVKGQLVLARHKRSTKIRAMTIKGVNGTTTKAIDLTGPVEAAIDFLGEAFGVRGRTPRKRAKSFDRPLLSPSINTGLPYTPHQALTYSTPLPQRAFSTMRSFPPMPILQQPIQYAVAHPESVIPDFDQLRRIEAHYKSIHGENSTKFDPSTIKAKGLGLKSAISIVKHTCGNCGRLRSKRYYAEHAINPGDIPIQEFCRKCQRDASSTSSSRSPSSCDNRIGSNHSNTKKKRSKALKRKAKRVSSEDDSSQSPGSEKQHNSPSKERSVNAKPIKDQLERQGSGHRVNKKTSVNKYDSDDDIIVNQDESSEIEFQTRGRARYRAEHPGISKRLSPPHLESTRLGARHEHHEISPDSLSRRRLGVSPGYEPCIPVYHHTWLNKDLSHSNNRQRSYERRSPIDHESEESRSHRLRIPDENSKAPTLRSENNSLYSSSFSSQESTRRQLDELASLDKETSSHNRKPAVPILWSRDEQLSTSRPTLYKIQKASKAKEACPPYDNTSESDVEQRSRTHGHHGEYYTHYHGDWTTGEPSPTLRNYRQRIERIKQEQGYRRGRYQDSDLSSLEDGNSDVTTTIPAFNNLPPAPTPPSFGKRILPEQQRRQVDPESESHYCNRNQNKSQYQEAFKLGHQNGAAMSTPFLGSPTNSDPFYAAINTIIDGDNDGKENRAKEEAIKHVTFRGTESVSQEDVAHEEGLWNNADGTKWA